MRDDLLRELLRRADADSPASVTPPRLLLQRIAQQDQRQRRQRRMAASGGLVALVAAGLIGWQLARRGDVVAPAPDAPIAQVAASQGAPANVASEELAEIDRLAQDADLHLRIAQRLNHVSSADRLRVATISESTGADEVENARERLDLVAYRMIAQADRVRESAPDHDTAIDMYRNVVRLFPTTSSAELVAARLAEFAPSHPPGGA